MKGPKVESTKNRTKKKEVKVVAKLSRSGLDVFRREFVKKSKKKYKNMYESNKEVLKAWNVLSDVEKKKYVDEARKNRPERVKRKYKVAFHTRSSLRQFKLLADHVKMNVSLREKVDKIGFGRLVDVGFTRLPRDVCVRVMHSYDPPTQQFQIRGKTKQLQSDDVGKILGIPYLGKKIVTTSVADEDPSFTQLKAHYFHKSYNNILDLIISGEEEHNFEFLFMLYTLGTLLSPSACLGVSERLLKLLCFTMDAFDQYDWSTYVMDEICKEMEDYVTVLRKKKGGSCNVGGCLYFLVIYFLENFPLTKSDERDPSNPIKFWTAKRLQHAIDKERKSQMGILYSASPAGVRTSEDRGPILADLDPDLEEMQTRLIAQLSAMVKDEVMKVQLKRHGKQHSVEDGEGEVGGEEEDAEGEATAEEEDVEGEADDEEDSAEGEDDGKPESGEGEADGKAESTEGNDGGKADSTEEDDDGKSESGEEEQDGEADDHGSLVLASPTNVSKEEKEEEVDEGHKLRRSMRQKKPAIESPWVVTKAVKRGQRKLDAKDRLFELVSHECPAAKGNMKFIQMHRDYLTRNELRSLGGWQRISNRVMSVVCKTLMAEISASGKVGRHIFDADFMSKMVYDPYNWSAYENRRHILEEEVGYNIAHCDLILGPALVNEHWFCYVLEPQTMNFYVLDSLTQTIAEGPNKQKKQKKHKGAMDDCQPTAHQECRDRFHDIMELVQPDVVGKKRKGEIIYPFVAQQSNTWDCGVYVMLWLRSWHPNAKLHYTPEEVEKFRRDLLWWLVNHPSNIWRTAVMRALDEEEKERRDKAGRSTQ